MSTTTTQTPDIDHAIRVLIHAKLPPLLEEEAKHIYNVLNSSAALNPATIDQVATAMANRLARLHRLSGCDALLDAASALGAKVRRHILGAEIEPAAPAEPAPAPKPAAPAEQDKAAKAETIEKIARLAKSDPDKFGEFALQLALKARDTLRTAGHATTEIDEAIKGLIGCRLTPDEAQVMCDPIVRLLKDAPDVDAAQAEHAVELAVAPDKAATEVQQ